MAHGSWPSTARRRAGLPRPTAGRRWDFLPAGETHRGTSSDGEAAATPSRPSGELWCAPRGVASRRCIALRASDIYQTMTGGADNSSLWEAGLSQLPSFRELIILKMSDTTIWLYAAHPCGVISQRCFVLLMTRKVSDHVSRFLFRLLDDLLIIRLRGGFARLQYKKILFVPIACDETFQQI